MGREAGIAVGVVMAALATASVASGADVKTFRVVVGGGRPDTTFRMVTGGGLRFSSIAGAMTPGNMLPTSASQREWDDVTMSGPVAGADVARFRSDLAADLVAIDLGKMSIPKVPAQTGLDVREKTFRPGRPTFGAVTFVANPTRDATARLGQWAKLAYDGRDARKDVRVELLGAKGEPVRTYVLTACVPSSYDSHALDGSTMLLSLVVTCQNVMIQGRDRPELIAWYTAQVAGQAPTRDVQVTYVGDGKEVGVLNARSAFLTSFRLPSLSAAKSGPVDEVVTFAPARIEQYL